MVVLRFYLRNILPAFFLLLVSFCFSGCTTGDIRVETSPRYTIRRLYYSMFHYLKENFMNHICSVLLINVQPTIVALAFYLRYLPVFLHDPISANAFALVLQNVVT